MTSVAMGRSAPRILVFCMYRDRARRMYLPPLLLALNPTTDPSPTNQPVRRVDKIFFFLPMYSSYWMYFSPPPTTPRAALSSAGRRAGKPRSLSPSSTTLHDLRMRCLLFKLAISVPDPTSCHASLELEPLPPPYFLYLGKSSLPDIMQCTLNSSSLLFCLVRLDVVRALPDFCFLE